MHKRFQWNAICDRCGKEYKSHQLKEEWTGLMVCHGTGTDNCWEPRHPQDFLRARKENTSVPWTRPEATDTFVDTCSMISRHPYAGYAQAGCASVGFTPYTPLQLDYNYTL